MTPQALAVLRVFSEAPDGAELYGRQIQNGTGLVSGTLHPILRRLLRHGWLGARWEDRSPGNEGRPVRRFYWLTTEGRAGAKEMVGRWREQQLKVLPGEEGGAVEMRILTRLSDVGGFEEALAVFLDSCPHVHGGYTFSCWPVDGEASG
jgi:PadR family transcriptional regulator, regulatory protein PadR